MAATTTTQKARTIVIPFFWYYHLACFAMSVYIGVKWNGSFPHWLIALYVAHAVSFPIAYYVKDKHGYTFIQLIAQLISMVVWIVTASLIAAARPNCNTDSGFFQTLIPTYPYEGPSAVSIAQVKCVFTGFQLSYGAMYMLLTVVGFLIAWCGDGDELSIDDDGVRFHYPWSKRNSIELPSHTPADGGKRFELA